MRNPKSLCPVACQRCKRRKQKCDGDATTQKRCSNCHKASQVCTYDTQPTIQYTRGLEKRVRELEREVERLKTSPHGSPSHAENEVLPFTGVSQVSRFGLESFTPWQRLIKGDVLGPGCITTEDYSSKLSQLMDDKVFLSSLFDVYLELVHIKYPFLLISYIGHLKDLVLSPGFQLLAREEQVNRDTFIALMLLAIGARVISDGEKTTDFGQSSESNHNVPSTHAVLFAKAISIQPDIYGVSGISTLQDVQAVVLLVIYLLRTPHSTLIWDMVRLVMGMCIHLGLHRKNIPLFESDPCHYQLRMKVFWSVYSLERVISNSFGRPYSLSDRDIDIEFPLDVHDSAETNPDYLRHVYYSSHPQANVVGFDTSKRYERGNGQDRSHSLAIHIFKLRRIDSEIQSNIYRVDEPHQGIPLNVIDCIKEKMKLWIQSLPENLSTFESDYCLYLFNKQICSLIQPFMTHLGPDDTLFKETIRSSVDVCLWSRRVHQNTSYQQSFISLQTAFLSGVTLAYALLSGKLTWCFEVGEGLRNCSTVLYLFSERSDKNACKYRDIFEALVSQVNEKRNISNPRSTDDGVLCGTDLFCQNPLKQRIQRIHRDENLKLFEQMSQQIGFIGQRGPDNNSVESINIPQGADSDTLDDIFESIWKLEFLPKDISHY